MIKLLKRGRILICLLVALTLLLIPATSALATNPTVTMTVTAGLLTITNSQDTWALGVATPDEVIYFSAAGTEDDDYSLATNTGNLAVDIEIQGTNFEGGTYDWTLATAAGDQQYSLYANSGNGTSTYDTEVKSSSYVDLIADLAPDAGYSWSMKFTAPSAFHASDDASEKSATVTLVVSEHV